MDGYADDEENSGCSVIIVIIIIIIIIIVYRYIFRSKVRPRRAADHSPPSSAAVMEEYSYTSTHPLGHSGPVTGSLHLHIYIYIYGPGSPVGIATGLRAGRSGIESRWGQDFPPVQTGPGPTQPPVKWVLSLSGGKVRPGRAADHSPPSSAAVMEEWSYTSTHPLGHTGTVTGSLYL